MKRQDDISDGPIQIDLYAVLRQKLGTNARHLPRWAVRPLEKLIRQEGLNDLLRYAWPRRGAAFCDAVLERLGVKLDVIHADRLPASPRVIIACNHPLGGLDGMALIRFIASVYGRDPYFVVNDMLMAVEPLSDVFVPVNKHGAQSRSGTQAIDDAFASDRPVIVFPAGLCSRRRQGRIVDLDWNKMFVAKAIETGRDIVPVHFIGENSQRFYRFAALREQTGIKLNIEMALLPSEVFRGAGRTYKLVCGEPLNHDKLDRNTRAEAARIKEIVYNLNQ